MTLMERIERSVQGLMDDAETCVLCGGYQDMDMWVHDGNGVCEQCAADFGLDWPTDEQEQEPVWPTIGGDDRDQDGRPKARKARPTDEASDG